MKLLGVFLLSLCFLLPAANAQVESAKNVLKKAEKALGKKSAVKAVNNWRKRGLIVRTSDGASGDFEMQAEKPGNFHAKFELRGFETEYGFNGRSAWMRDSREGLRTLTGKESDDLKGESTFRAWNWRDWKKRKYKAIRDGDSFVGDRRTKVVVIANAGGERMRLHFDAETYLLLREEIPFGEETKTFDYSDYRIVDGVKEAFVIKTNVSHEPVTLQVDQVEHNAIIARTDFDFPRELGKPLPDISALLDTLRINEERVEKLLENYTFTEKSTKRELGKKGVLQAKSTTVKQISFYKGYRIERVIEKDGKPLSANDQKKQDKKVESRVKDIEKEARKEEERIAKQNATGEPSSDGRQISVAEVLRASSLKNPRREVLKGRNVIVFDFEPNPEFDFKNAKSFLKFFGKTIGVMWVDEKDSQVARVEAILADNFNVGGGVLAKLRKGASFTLEKERFNNEIWLPSTTDINLSIRVLLFGGVKVNQLIEAYDYQRFNTEVIDSNVGETEED